VAGTPGTWVQVNSSSYQPLAANLTAWAGKTAPSGVAVGTTDVQTLSSKTFTPTATNAIGMAVKALSGQTSNIQEWQNNLGAALAAVTSNGTLTGAALTTDFYANRAGTGGYFDTTTDTIKLIQRVAGTVLVQIRGAAAQSGNLTEWQTSTPTTVASVSSAGVMSSAVGTSSGNVATIDGTQTLTNKTLTSPAINTPTGIVKGDVGLGNVDNTSNATERAATATLTNKRITPRVTSIVSSATPTVNTDNTDFVTITALAVAVTSMTTNLSGTPTDGQMLRYRIKDDGTARAITWGASFVARGVTPPTTTTAGKVTNVGFNWNTATSTWDCVASSTEA
jgi:hypothetical protein